MPALTVGSTAPDFRLNTLDGATFSLAEALTRGPVVAIFFKISCPTCQYALPYFERLYQQFRNSSATVIGICQNDEDGAEQFAHEYGITMPIALDDPANYAVSNAYGLTNVPTMFLITPDGTIGLSSVSWAKAEVEEVARRLAAAESRPPQPVFQFGEDVAELKIG